MELRGDEERMAVQLADLHPGPALGPPGEPPSGGLDPVDVVGVDLVSVPVPLGHQGGAVQSVRLRPLGDDHVLGSETHGGAHVPDTLLLVHDADHGVRRVRVELGAAGHPQSEDVPADLDRGYLEPEADSEERDVVLPGVSGGRDLPLDAPGPEPSGDYDAVSRFLTENGIETTHDCLFSLYLPCRADFSNRYKYDFPIVAISLSDYNAVRATQGLAPITLGGDEFTTQWQAIATDEERDGFLQTHLTLSTDAGTLTLAAESYYEANLGETLYNTYTDVVYILPDEVCAQLLPVMRNRYIMTAQPLPYETARALESAFTADYPEQTAEGVSYGIRLRTLQVNSARANNFVLQAAMLYGGVVLMVICLTILSLQQLLDAGQYRYRFSVLCRLGVEESHIRRLVLQQLGFWFGLPVGTAVLVGAGAAGCFIAALRAEIEAYIGFGALAVQLGVTAAILAVLLGCYFVSTWVLFRRAIET